jgi:hypothetical protein
VPRPLEEGELLLTVGGIVRGIEIDRDPSGAAVPPPLLLRDDGVGQHVGQGAQLPRGHRILEARQRGLGGQAQPGQRIAVEDQLVDGVVDSRAASLPSA